MDFTSDDEIFTGMTWSRMVFFLVGSVTVAYCTVLLTSVEFGCSPFSGIGVFPGRLLSSFTGLIPSVGFSSVPPWVVVKKSVVLFCHSHMDITFRIHTCLYAWCEGLIQTGHNLWCLTISQRLWRSLFCNSGMKPVWVILSSTNSSACSLGAYSVYHLFQVFQCLLRWNQLQRMKSALDLKGHLFHLVVSFCLLFSRWLSSQQHLQILGHS